MTAEIGQIPFFIKLCQLTLTENRVSPKHFISNSFISSNCPVITIISYILTLLESCNDVFLAYRPLLTPCLSSYRFHVVIQSRKVHVQVPELNFIFQKDLFIQHICIGNWAIIHCNGPHRSVKKNSNAIQVTSNQLCENQTWSKFTVMVSSSNLQNTFVGFHYKETLFGETQLKYMPIIVCSYWCFKIC